ncbi:hypothetical protein Egran_01777 [Elaphomyces granulatus]|uniref:Methyltransferase domain-containing protein n=1 Tax=Elaphomyces granulatus TaxID=519963 RepID=A0A232M268_9EURO|nr:hypothetical protein Egran_01777 [Elaphomyces granulatus]
MQPKTPLPLSSEWKDPASYVTSLLSFATSSELFQQFCGGIHIVDFLTHEPDLYTTLLPEEWRQFFDRHDTQDILDLLIREDVSSLEDVMVSRSEDGGAQDDVQQRRDAWKWKAGPLPPKSLLDYIRDIRKFSLRRDFQPQVSDKGTSSISRNIAVGMRPKKRHEVENFSRYVNSLSANVAQSRGQPVTHIVDFGSGQNYLGRTLASPPYNKHIIAIERRHDCIRGARSMDISAKLTRKNAIEQNPKEHRRRPPVNRKPEGWSERPQDGIISGLSLLNSSEAIEIAGDPVSAIHVFRDVNIEPGDICAGPSRKNRRRAQAEDLLLSERKGAKGVVDYIEHDIQDGYLEPIIHPIVQPPADEACILAGSSATNTDHDREVQTTNDAKVMVVSLHSCGNLLHHGVRSLILNRSVVAIAMVGCCYNLMTERLGPATYKLPLLRSRHPRLEATSIAYDPHGFPMSKQLEAYRHGSGTGVRLNITARSMALQAPYNWGRIESEDFFTRHFYRALFQRVLRDRGVIPRPDIPTSLDDFDAGGDSPSSHPPVIVGSLRKSAFASFPAYVRAAISKLSHDPDHGTSIRTHLANVSDEELERYAARYRLDKKKLSIVWCLMAFSAMVAEAIIVVDRWQFLREHPVVRQCWVEPVFDYAESPRNLAVIGIKG